MGNVATPQALAFRWAEVMNDPCLRNLPYKIELNVWGKIEMSPATTWHARIQGRITVQLERQLQAGEVLVECPVLTEIGVRVPDVAWASNDFLRAHGDATPCPRAPELCIEVVLASNTEVELQEKTHAYLAAGANEVWLVFESGAVQYFDRTGRKTVSQFPVTLTLPEPIKP